MNQCTRCRSINRTARVTAWKVKSDIKIGDRLPTARARSHGCGYSMGRARAKSALFVRETLKTNGRQIILHRIRLRFNSALQRRGRSDRKERRRKHIQDSGEVVAAGKIVGMKSNFSNPNQKCSQMCHLKGKKRRDGKISCAEFNKILQSQCGFKRVRTRKERLIKQNHKC